MTLVVAMIEVDDDVANDDKQLTEVLDYSLRGRMPFVKVQSVKNPNKKLAPHPAFGIQRVTVVHCEINRQPGWLYYIDGHGNVSASWITNG